MFKKMSLKKRQGNRPLGRPSHRWEENITAKLENVEREGGYWIQLVQNR
jgi:hypothetical protein